MRTASVVSPADGVWVEAWLSVPRFERYLAAANGDRAHALALYEWNAQVSAAFQRDLAHLEVALRNAYERAATTYWVGPGHWLLNDADAVFAPVYRTRKTGEGRTYRTDINVRPRALVTRAIKQAGGPNATPGKVVAELSFGFWRYLSSSAHEKTLWVPLLHRAFPRRTKRAEVDGEVRRIHEVRNRVAHHEPLLAQDLAASYADLLRVAGRLSNELAGHLARTSGVPGLIAARPRNPGTHDSSLL